MRQRIGNLRAFDESEIKHIRHSEDTRTLRPGDIVETIVSICEWDTDCVSLEMSESWRGEGDPLCDRALRDVFSSASSSVGKDLLRTLEEHTDSEAAQAFLDEVHQAPPAGILASDEEIALAQEFFLDNAIQIMQALLHYSLAGGFSSPRIVRTLEAVSYLVPHVRKGAEGSSPGDLSTILADISKESTDRTFSRLLETFQFVLDVMGCLVSARPVHPISQDLKDTHTRNVDYERSQDSDDIAYLMPGGEGWRSTVRVRLLHGVARWRVEERWAREGDPQAGVPVSQEDMAATLAAFSTAPIWCLNRLGMPPSSVHTSAYLALWRHVGFYLGVSPAILHRHFHSPSTADKFLATAALHLFSDDTSPPGAAGQSALRRGPTIPILVAVSDRAPLHNTLTYNIALTAHLLGPALATHLGLPPAPLRVRIRMHVFLALQRAEVMFGVWCARAAWRAKRRAVLREGMARSVRWNLGQRRTTFRPRTGVQEGEAGVGGELAAGVGEEEAIERDPARAKVLGRMWREVWVEMVAVCAVVGVSGLVLTYMVLRLALTTML